MNRNRRDKMRANFPTFDMAFDRAMADFEAGCAAFAASLRALGWPATMTRVARVIRTIEPLVLTEAEREATR